MHPLKQIQSLLKERTANQGKVVKVGEEIRVTTNYGMVSVQPNPNDLTRYRVGDSVLLANGVIVGRRMPATKVYVV
jgi:hypothetical protein